MLKVLVASNAPRTVTSIFKMCHPPAPRISVHRSLERMLSHRLLTRDEVGDVYLYALNRSHILYPIIRELTSPPPEQLQRLVADQVSVWKTWPTAVFAFGSAATGTMTLESDIDLLFLFQSEEEKHKCFNGIADLGQLLHTKTGNAVSPLSVTPGEIQDSALLEAIRNDGVLLFGDATALPRPASPLLPSEP